MERNIEDSPPVSPKPRRRSSFFERRTSTVMPFPQPVDDTTINDDEKLDDTKQKEVELYMERLNKEKSSWEDLSRSRKAVLRDAKKWKCNSVDSAQCNLPEEDAAFLASRPALERIAEGVHSLACATQDVLALRRRLQDAWLRSVRARLESAVPVVESILNKSSIC